MPPRHKGVFRALARLDPIIYLMVIRSSWALGQPRQTQSFLRPISGEDSVGCQSCRKQRQDRPFDQHCQCCQMQRQNGPFNQSCQCYQMQRQNGPFNQSCQCCQMQRQNGPLNQYCQCCQMQRKNRPFNHPVSAVRCKDRMGRSISSVSAARCKDRMGRQFTQLPSPCVFQSAAQAELPTHGPAVSYSKKVYGHGRCLMALCALCNGDYWP